MKLYPQCFCKQMQTTTYEVVNGSYLETSNTKQDNKTKDTEPAILDTVGAFQKLPMIRNYPFTTRGILMGHIALSFWNFQVTDTPGILRRSDEDRNNLEKLTLVVLSHLPTAILFVQSVFRSSSHFWLNAYDRHKNL